MIFFPCFRDINRAFRGNFLPAGSIRGWRSGGEIRSAAGLGSFGNGKPNRISAAFKNDGSLLGSQKNFSSGFLQAVESILRGMPIGIF